MSDCKELRPRKYQEEIFSCSKKENIIAALDTGAGKTYISLMLIRWIVSLETSRGKLIVFLVPKVPLVEQQGDFIARHSPLKVIKLSGELDINLGDRAGWKKRLENNDVAVMTAQIFLDLLLHTNWAIDRVSLMVFDECHHTRKNHPFNLIMTEYFQTAEEQRPKVFGLTASPVWNVKNPEQALVVLEKNLDAKIIAVQENIVELSTHAPRPVQLVKQFSAPPANYDIPFVPLWSWLQYFDDLDLKDPDFPWSKIERRYSVTLEGLGTYGASLYLYLELLRRITNLIATCSGVPTSPLLGDEVTFASTECPQELYIVKDMLSDYDEHFKNDASVPLDWCSPKVQCLVDILLEYHTPSFQGIVFVEQRQTAICLAELLSRIPSLKDRVECAAMVGSQTSGDSVSKAAANGALKLFRERAINLLIATSVAEEGLDFPACDLVVRFDPLSNMVAYLQSRGRIRNRSSTFIIMLREDDTDALAKYQVFMSSEADLKKVYQSRGVENGEAEEEDGGNSSDDDDGSVEDERYVVPRTGAVLTYGSAIGLLANLCELIPRDIFTPPHRPEYTGDFCSTLRLPSSLPLPPEDRVFVGPLKSTKKQARRAVAFAATQRLHELGVFDDYLLPAAARKKGDMDADGCVVTFKVADVPAVMDVQVLTPFVAGHVFFCHPVLFGGRYIAGLISGTPLSPSHFRSRAHNVVVGSPTSTWFSSEKLSLMCEFTMFNIFHHVTGRPLTGRPSVYLVPVKLKTSPYDDAAEYDVEPDFDSIIAFLRHPYGNFDWSEVEKRRSLQDLLLMNSNEYGRVYVLVGVRSDLTPMSTPDVGTIEYGHATYFDYFVDRWTRKGSTKWTPRVPETGPLLEVWRRPKSDDGSYPLRGDLDPIVHSANPGCLIPQGSTGWFDLSEDIISAYSIFPAILNRVSHTYRVRRAKTELALPAIDEDLFIEALTLPCAGMKYSNQRLETLGDAVLELCTTVYLFNKFPHRHEGQLTILRAASVSNRCLLSRAKEIGLEKYLICERASVADWQHIDDPECYYTDSSIPKRMRHVVFPRRSLQDCMEATLGASFVTGGIDMALRTGTALGLTFGGMAPWDLRYPVPPQTAVPTLVRDIQERLHYQFRQGHLLVEALTHPSFSSSDSLSSSYQRLEFMGDALINLIVVDYLYRKFPNATSFQLSMPRSKAVCSPALASLAVRRLQLHKMLLVNNVELSVGIARFVPILEETTPVDIIRRGWRLDPPKALSDVFESVVGALFIDTHYNYDKTAGIVEFLMEDLLDVLSPSLPLDPLSDLIIYLRKAGCNSKIDWRYVPPWLQGLPPGYALYLHDTLIVRPITTLRINITKKLAAERALATLQGPDPAKNLASICQCEPARKKKSQVLDESNMPNVPAVVPTQ
ncbi:hypothetical protein FISHEDRAFT_43443 [Fistulina hepatica ATCC 64428]|uniref:P-loop containing nucleoside triphosphate hydrolase protein n=1 Tax=Fistulina hepatica ATCC 64428 TaxID=1128425 RepID=A0A0D7ACF0_9AGAR|nr:hypothetical protein FISHEDRAFT_43443 [Fistulina hepatica ATCC 64428]